jgi:hypothetical protein
MGRFSPPAYVTDRSGELLAQALEQATNGFVGGIERGRERRHQRDVEKQQHDDVILGMELSHPGLHRPGAAVPTGTGNALAASLPNSPLIDDEYGSNQGPVAAPSRDRGFGSSLADALPMPTTAPTPPMPMKPANSGRGAMPPAAAAPMAPIPGHPGAFDPTTGAFRDGQGVPKVGNRPNPAAAPAAAPAPRVRQLSNGWTMNDDESDAALMHGKELERAFADRDRSRKVNDLVRAGYSPTDAALAVDNPGMADNIWDRAHPKAAPPRSVEHIDAGNRVEVRDALTGALINTIPKGPAPVSPEAQATRDAAAGSRKDALLSRTEARLVQQYQQSTHKYSQTADAIQAINENREGALRGDPVAQQTLLQDFIKLNLPGQIVTAGELHNYAGLMGLGDRGGTDHSATRTGLAALTEAD